MTRPASEQQPDDDARNDYGYFERDVDEFHREANVLAGHSPVGVSSDPPVNLRARRLMVFAVLTVIGLLAGAVAIGLMAIPPCENPQYNWMPCVPDL